MREGVREGVREGAAQGLPCTVSMGQEQMHSLPSPAQGFSRWHQQDELDVEFFLKHHLVILSLQREKKVPGRHLLIFKFYV